jgi:peptidoglycan/LPS O-acetylase OafA/YrhL
MKEIRPLTSLRAFAAFLVFMYHYTWLFPPAQRGFADFVEFVPFQAIWRQGQVGVSIFFVLSGFLITRIYFDKVAQGRSSLRLFLVKRVARIWPLFLVFAAVQHVWQWAIGTPFTASDIVTLTMSQAFFEGLRYSGLPTAWSLTIEESFYALAPILFLLVARFVPWTRRENQPELTWPRLFSLALAVAGVVLALIFSGEALVRLCTGLGLDWQGFMGSRHHMLHSTLFGRFPEFAIGVVAAFVHRCGRLEAWLPPGRATLVLLGSFVGIALSLWTRTLMEDGALTLPGGHLWFYILAYLVAGLSAVLILSLSVSGGAVHRFLGHGLFVYLGKISYGFYLIQLTILIEPMVHLSDRFGPLRLLGLMVMVNIFCAIVYELVEAPARRSIVARWGIRRGPLTS